MKPEHQKTRAIIKTTETIEEIDTMPTAPTQDEVDEEAMLQAARHREEASTLVRDHLGNHAANNPGASSDYVTWVATLHPENADITIDHRFFVPGNPWWTIYEDTKNSEIPIATAEPVSNKTLKIEVEDSTSCTSESSNENQRDPTESSAPHFCQRCNPIAMFCGFAVAIPALVCALACEMVALIACYAPGSMFYHAAQVFAPPSCCTCLFYFALMLVHFVLSFCDTMILLVSVITTECLGLVAFLIGFLTGGCLWARYLQQQIRRLCHGIRIIFRKKTPSNKPRRRFFFDRNNNDNAKPHMKGVKVVRVTRVRRPGESYH